MLVKPGCSFRSLLPAPLDQLLKVGVKLGNIKERREEWECLEQPRTWNCCGGENREMGSTQQGLRVSIPGVSHIPKALGHDPALSESSERGWRGPFFRRQGNAIPRELLPTRIPHPAAPAGRVTEDRHWPKPSLGCLSRVGKAPPGSVSARLNLSQNKQSSSFQLLFPTGLVCSPFLLQCLDSPASNYCLQI